MVVVDSEYRRVTAFAEKDFNRSSVILGIVFIALILGLHGYPRLSDENKR